MRPTSVRRLPGRVWQSVLALALVGLLVVGVVVISRSRPVALAAQISALTTPTSAAGTRAHTRSDPAPAPPADLTAPAGFARLAFADDFDGGTLDRRRWLPSRDGRESGAFNPDREGAYFDPDNVTVADGQLHLTLQEAHGKRVWGKSYPWSSGAVSTEGRFTFGDDAFLAARIQLPVSDGLWPAFWTAVPDRWPPETDIFEFFGTHQQSRPKFNYHPPEGPYVGTRFYGDPDVDYRHGWHTYGLLRRDGVLTPYLDGVAYPEASVTGADALEHHIILNLSAYAGRDPEPGSRMAIDWVRVWTP